MKILNVEPARYDETLRKRLGELGVVEYVECRTQSDFQDVLANAEFDAVFIRLGLALDRRALEACPSLRFVVTPTTGLDHIDVELAHQRGVDIISLKGETSFLQEVKSTAEHTWALLLALIRKIPTAHADVVGGNWRREPFLADELHGRRLGIIGYGRLGAMVGEYGRAFGMEVIAYDRRSDLAIRGVEFMSVDAVLGSSDYISLHLPLDSSTAGFMNAGRLGQIQSHAYLVNTARGELIDEGALLHALRMDEIAGAALDVLVGDSRWTESRPADHPLVAYATNHANLIITPHVGGFGRQSIGKTRSFIVDRFTKQATAGSRK